MQVQLNLAPTECTLYMTDICNFNCLGCRRQTVEKPRHNEVDVELLKKILLEYPSLESFCLAGYGEPTIARHFTEVVDYLKENGKYVGIITNGTYPERLMKLKNSPDYISISLYGYTAEQYKNYVGVNAFKRVMENYSTIKNRFKSVGFSYFVNRENYKTLDKILELCDELKPDFLNLANYLSYDENETEDTRLIIKLSDVEIIKYIEDRINTRSYINTRPIYLDDEDREYKCPSYSKVINVDGHGSIGGCQRQMPPSPVYGNIRTDEDPYNNVVMHTIRKRINEDKYPHPNCATCFGRHNPFEIWHKVNMLNEQYDADVAVMLLFHEKVDQTIECLKSFIPSGRKIYILNNGSSKESASELKKYCKKYSNVKIFDSEKNLGVAVGRNYLLQNTSEEWAFFVDNDIYVTKNDWLRKFVLHKKSNPNVEVFIPRLFNLHENSFVTYYKWALEGNKITYHMPKKGLLANFPGGASIINRRIFKRLGLYDDQMFVGFEDFEFAIRGMIANMPVTAKLIDDIELVHDHRKIVKTVDKEAVMVRYNEDAHQKSIERIEKKFPNLDFKHEWQSWVQEQKKKLLEQENYDLTTLTPEYNYGARTKNRLSVILPENKYNDILGADASEKINRQISKEKIENVVIFQPVEAPERYSGLTECKTPVFISLKDLAGFNFTADLNTLLKVKGFNTIDPNERYLFIIDNVLEKLEDPRFLLRALKKALMLNSCNRGIVISKNRIGQGIDYPEDSSSYREWNSGELKLHLVSGGFNILQETKNDSNGREENLFTISADIENYEKYLKSLMLPGYDLKYLICSNEHGKALLTGGIGSYVEEAKKIFLENEFGILLVSTGNMLPVKTVLDEERIITFSRFFDQQNISKNETAEMLFKTIQVVQYIYPDLKIVEVQDVEGFGYRVVQGKGSGLVSNELTIQIVGHGSKIYLENASQRWLPITNYDVIFKEKIALENADRVLIPTRFLIDLYNGAGYRIEKERLTYQRLPFNYHSFPDNQYTDADTLIFYGKRYTMKGFDLFTEMTALLDVDGIIGNKIKRIVLIGPFFPEMEKQNKYIDALKKRVEVVEVSLPREEAIGLIKKLHTHSVCVLPYKSDNHPYSVMELVETGCPYIFARAGGIPEMLPEEFHGMILGDPECGDLAAKFKKILELSNNERYSLYKSVFSEMKRKQKETNDGFIKYNRTYANNNISSALPQAASESNSLVVTDITGTGIERINALFNALGNQTIMPNRVVAVCDSSRIDELAAQFGVNKIPVEFFKSVNSFNETKNLLLTQADEEFIIILAKGDIPKSDFVELLCGYLNVNKNYDCVSSYGELHKPENDLMDSSLIESVIRPLGETGVLDIAGKNKFALESCAFRSSFMKKIGGWETYKPGPDDLHTFIKIKTSGGKIGIISKSLILRQIDSNDVPVREDFGYQMRRAVNMELIDKFDAYRLTGMIYSSGFGAPSKSSAEISEIEKYLITVQTLLLNGKIAEAYDIVNSIDPKIAASTDKAVLKKIELLKKKIEAVNEQYGIISAKEPVNEQSPLVSVIIPTYNRPDQLKEAIQSVLAQTYGNFEILVVNDAGVDVSDNLRAFNDQRIKYFVHDENKGLAGARNTGLANSNGDYISFLDDDDIFYPNHLETLLNALLINGVDIVYADAYRCLQKKQEGKYVEEKKELQYSFDYSQRLLLVMNIAPVQCFMFSRALLTEDVYFDESLTTHEDWDFWIQLSLKTDFLHIKEITSEYRHRQDGSNMVTTKLPDFLRTMKIIFERYSVFTGDDVEVKGYQEGRIREMEEQIKVDLPERACSIVVVTYNSAGDISNCLKSVKPTLRRFDEVIVVDNGSKDQTVRIVKEIAESDLRFRLIEAGKNLGFSEGTNTGIREARNPYIIMLNPDTMVTGDWINSMVNHLERDKSAGAAGPISNYVAGLQKMELYAKTKPEGSVSFEELYKLFRESNNGQGIETKILIGFCLIIRKSLINAMGLLDPDLFLGNDDLDLSWRLRLKGYRLIVACDTFVYHKGQQSFKTEKKSKTDLLVQESTDILYRKLESFYGKDSIPSPIELWGIDWFKPTGAKFNKSAGLLRIGKRVRTSIIIPVFNQLEYTIQCVESIEKTVNERIQIVIVNNASSDNTLGFLNKVISAKIDMTIVNNDTNRGFPEAVNQGIKQALGDFIIIANNDIVFTDGWLERMIEVVSDDSGIGIVGPVSNEVSGLQKDENAKYNSMEEMHKYAETVKKMNKGEILNFPRLAFLCTLIMREVIDSIGGLDERFSPGNYEDDDFCLRAQLAGFKAAIAKDVFIHHYGSKSFKADGNEAYKERLRINEKKFIDKWGATPDTIWLRNAEIKPHQYLFPLDLNDYNEKIARARVNIADREYEMAMENLEKALDIYDNDKPENIVMQIQDLYNLAGNLSLVSRNFEKAEMYFSKELELNPDSSPACVGLGDLMYENENFEGAKTMYEWGVKNDMENNAAIEGLARANKALGLPETDNSLAGPDFTGKSVEDILNEAYTFFERGELKEAVDFLNIADNYVAAMDSQNGNAEDIAAFYNMKGFVYLGLKDQENAKNSFEKALNTNPNSSQACVGLGELFYQSGQYESAKIMYEWGIKNNPNNEVAKEALAKVNNLV